MPSRYRRVVRGNQFADDILRKLGYELREARLAAGLSLRDTERGSGISRAQISRLERGAAPGVSLRDLTVLFAVLGQRLPTIARERPDHLARTARPADERSGSTPVLRRPVPG